MEIPARTISSPLESRPLISFGKKALEDCKNNVPTEAIEQVALDIIITAGLVSNFTVHENNPNPDLRRH